MANRSTTKFIVLIQDCSLARAVFVEGDIYAANARLARAYDIWLANGPNRSGEKPPNVYRVLRALGVGEVRRVQLEWYGIVVDQDDRARLLYPGDELRRPTEQWYAAHVMGLNFEVRCKVTISVVRTTSRLPEAWKGVLDAS